MYGETARYQEFTNTSIYSMYLLYYVQYMPKLLVKQNLLEISF